MVPPEVLARKLAADRREEHLVTVIVTDDYALMWFVSDRTYTIAETIDTGAGILSCVIDSGALPNRGVKAWLEKQTSLGSWGP